MHNIYLWISCCAVSQHFKIKLVLLYSYSLGYGARINKHFTARTNTGTNYASSKSQYCLIFHYYKKQLSVPNFLTYPLFHTCVSNNDQANMTVTNGQFYVQSATHQYAKISLTIAAAAHELDHALWQPVQTLSHGRVASFSLQAPLFVLLTV